MVCQKKVKQTNLLHLYSVSVQKLFLDINEWFVHNTIPIY